MVRNIHPAQVHGSAAIPHSFEMFYAATVIRILNIAMQVIGEREIIHRATQDAYAVMLVEWADRQSQSLRENVRFVLDLAVQRAADLCRQQGRFAAFSAVDVCKGQPHDSEFGPHWFDIRDGLQELAIRTGSPSVPLSETLSSALVLDGHSLWRKAIAAQLIQMGAGTVYEAETVAEARAHACAAGPCDLAILELGWPDGSGIELLTELRSHGWPRRIVVALSHEPRALRSAFDAGAQAYLRKSALPIALTDGVCRMPEGGGYPDPGVAAILGLSSQIANTDTSPYELSAREVNVLQLVAEGQSNKEIGETLNLSALTVKSHLSRISRKLGTGDRAQMVALVMRAGIIR